MEEKSFNVLVYFGCLFSLLALAGATFIGLRVMAMEEDIKVLQVSQNEVEKLVISVSNNNALKYAELNSAMTALQEEVYEYNESLFNTKLLEMQIELNTLEQIEDKQEYMRRYMEIAEKYSDWIDLPETLYDQYTATDIMYLQRMVETEVHGGDFESKVHVAHVAMNRVENELYPDTLTSVITQPNQFAYSRTVIDESTKLACEYAAMFPDTVQGALAFHSNTKTNTFGRYIYIFTDNVGHHFYN